MKALPVTALSLLLSVLLLFSAAPAAAETLDEITVGPEFRHRFVGEVNALPGPPPGRTTTLGSGSRLFRFSIEVEEGIDADEDSVRAEVIRILGDRRSWIAEGTMRFQTSSVADADVRIRVASPATVDRRCHPLGTGGRLSCRNGLAVAPARVSRRR